MHYPGSLIIRPGYSYLLETNSRMNTHFKTSNDDDEDDDNDNERVSISEMLPFLIKDISLDKGEIIDQDNSTDLLLASFGFSTASITWDQIKRFTRDDEMSTTRANWIATDCPGPQTSLTQDLRTCWGVCGHLQVKEGVPMMLERVIIPKELRPRVLETLHMAHQGVYMMMLRAQDTVYWPGILGDIEKTRAKCATCQAIPTLTVESPSSGPNRARLPISTYRDGSLCPQ